MSNAMYPTSIVTLENGDKHEVTPANADMCRLEIVGAKENISLKDTPITALTFTAWAFLKRTGAYSGTWAEFRGQRRRRRRRGRRPKILTENGPAYSAVLLAVHTGVSPDYWMNADDIIADTAMHLLRQKYEG